MNKDRRIFALRNGFLLTAVLAALSSAAVCQTAPPPPQHQDSQATFAYDAVTIKPDPDGHGFFKLSPDSFSMGGMPAWVLIRSAYGVLMEGQVVGLPGWAKTEPIAVEAKMDADTTRALRKLPPMEQWKQMQLMLQAGGSKMKQTSPDTTGGNANYASGKVTAHQISIASLAANLSFAVGRVVVNKTGLDGGYDFTLDYAPDGADPSDTRPSIFTALEEQLGLKLEPARGPVDVIVVDHIERPTEN